MEICEMKISFLFFHNCGKIKMMSLGKFAANISHHLFHLIFFFGWLPESKPQRRVKVIYRAVRKMNPKIFRIHIILLIACYFFFPPFLYCVICGEQTRFLRIFIPSYRKSWNYWLKFVKNGYVAMSSCVYAMVLIWPKTDLKSTYNWLKLI